MLRRIGLHGCAVVYTKKSITTRSSEIHKKNNYIKMDDALEELNGQIADLGYV